MGLQKQIFLALLLGVFSGLFFGELCSPLEIPGKAYIMLLKMTILPYMSCALIHAIGSLSFENARTLFVKAFKFLILLWAATFTVIYALALTFPRFDRASYFSSPNVPEQQLESLLDLFIPVNPFHALANDIIPAVVVFSLLFGLALIQRKQKKTFLTSLQVIISALTSITHWVNRLSPIGVFCLIASRTGTISFQQVVELEIYIYCFYAGAVFLALYVFPMIVSSFCQVKSKRFIQAIQPAALLAFTTGNNLVSLPLIMEGIEDLAKEKKIPEEESKSTIETMVPIAYNFPTAGNLFAMLFILFLASFYAVSLNALEHLKLVFTGLFVLFGAASSVINGVSFLIDQVHLPLDGFTLFIQTMPLTRNFQTMLSSVQIATLTTLVCFAYSGKVKFNPTKFSKKATLSVFLLGGILFFGTFLTPSEEKQTKEVFTSLTLSNPVKYKIFKQQPPPQTKSGDALDRVKGKKVLRVGYVTGIMPFSYTNKQGDLVGYDIALAHELARSLDATIEFVPFTFPTMIEDLNSGKFDIAMSAVSVNNERLAKLRFSNPYLSTERAFVVRDYRRDEFTESRAWITNPDIKIAVLKGTSYEQSATELFPEDKLVRIETPEAFMKDGVADALLWTKEEGTTWSLINPKYTTIRTNIPLGREHFAYAMSEDSPKMQEFVNYWLDIKKLDEFIVELEEYWIMGKVPKDKPRWSIIRDVLGWID